MWLTEVKGKAPGEKGAKVGEGFVFGTDAATDTATPPCSEVAMDACGLEVGTLLRRGVERGQLAKPEKLVSGK